MRHNSKIIVDASIQSLCASVCDTPIKFNFVFEAEGRHLGLDDHFLRKTYFLFEFFGDHLQFCEDMFSQLFFITRSIVF